MLQLVNQLRIHHHLPLSPLSPGGHQDSVARIDYDHCLSADSLQVKAYTVRPGPDVCVILLVDRYSGEFSALGVTGTETSVALWRETVWALLQHVDNAFARSTALRLRFRALMAFHEFYNSSYPTRIHGIDYAIYSHQDRHFFTLVPVGGSISSF